MWLSTGDTDDEVPLYPPFAAAMARLAEGGLEHFTAAQEALHTNARDAAGNALVGTGP